MQYNCQANVCSLVLSRYNKDLEQQTFKPSVHHSSRVLDKPCYSSQANQCYSSILFRRQQENPSSKCEGMPTQRLEEKRVEECAGRERERGRESMRARTQERVHETALWFLLFYVFSSTWACPMQIGLSQECYLFCLKFSLWSSDLPLTFLVFQPPPFWTPFPYSTYLTFPPQEIGGPISHLSHYIPTTLAKMKKTENARCWSNSMEQLELTYIAGRVQNGTTVVEKQLGSF